MNNIILPFAINRLNRSLCMQDIVWFNKIMNIFIYIYHTLILVSHHKRLYLKFFNWMYFISNQLDICRTYGTITGDMIQPFFHYNDVIMSAIASQISSLTIVYSDVYSGVDQRKHQSSASLAFVRGIHRWQVNSPHKRPITRKMFSFDDVIMYQRDVPCSTWNIM